MINTMKLTFQIMAISCFGFLTIIGVMQKDWNFGFLLNLALTILYIALYLQPVK